MKNKVFEAVVVQRVEKGNDSIVFEGRFLAENETSARSMAVISASREVEGTDGSDLEVILRPFA